MGQSRFSGTAVMCWNCRCRAREIPMHWKKIPLPVKYKMLSNAPEASSRFAFRTRLSGLNERKIPLNSCLAGKFEGRPVRTRLRAPPSSLAKREIAKIGEKSPHFAGFSVLAGNFRLRHAEGPGSGPGGRNPRSKPLGLRVWRPSARRAVRSGGGHPASARPRRPNWYAIARPGHPGDWQGRRRAAAARMADPAGRWGDKSPSGQTGATESRCGAGTADHAQAGERECQQDIAAIAGAERAESGRDAPSEVLAKFVIPEEPLRQTRLLSVNQCCITSES